MTKHVTPHGHSETEPVFCFGEILWDCLPDGLFLGGAPLNVAYHLHRLGCPVMPVSAVGDDFLGHEALRRIAAWGMPTDAISILPAASGFPTGTVTAILDAKGNASYQIHENVAWDHISVVDAMNRNQLPPPRAIVFGSLAARSSENRRHLAELIDYARNENPHLLSVFDVNLRSPYDDQAVVESLLPFANLLKLNHDEAARLTGERPQNIETNARDLSSRWEIASICITAGDRGAGLLHDGVWFWESAQPVQVADTVGAGDSFLAALVAGWPTKPEQIPSLLARACRLAEFVASQRGAQPKHPSSF